MCSVVVEKVYTGKGGACGATEVSTEVSTDVWERTVSDVIS